MVQTAGKQRLKMRYWVERGAQSAIPSSRLIGGDLS